MNKSLTNSELKKIYRILKAYVEGLIVNPTENWEMEHYDEPVADKKGLSQVIAKIEKLLSKEDFEETSKSLLRRKYDSFNNFVDEKVYRKIEQAFNNKKTVEIGYFNMDSAEAKKREIDVYYKSSRYVIAYCHLRRAMRKFRTSRILSAKLTDKKYRIPADFDKNNY